MSVKTMSLVWEHSTQKNSKLVAMLAIADQSDDDGVCSRMALSRDEDADNGKFDVLADKVRVNDRRMHGIIAELEESGEIFTEHNGGRHRINRYLVTVGRSVNDIRLVLVRRFDMSGEEATATAESIAQKQAAENPAKNCSVLESTPENPAKNCSVSGPENPAKNCTVLESTPENPAKNCSVSEPKTLQKIAETLQEIAPLINININNLKDSKTKDSDFSDFCDSEFGKVIDLYAQNIDPNFTPTDAQALGDTFDELTPPAGETKLDWFKHAILGACENNVKNRPYVEGILQNIQDAGSLARHKAAKNIKAAPAPASANPPANGNTRRPRPATPTGADTDTWAAILAALKPSLTVATFTQFSGSYAVGRNGQALVVAVPNPQALEWIQVRLQTPVNRVAGAIEPDLSVKFISAERQPA